MTTFVLMAGLPGTGKSTLAEALARRLKGIVLSKDVVRAALFPGELTDYTSEQDDLCMEAVLQAAQYLGRHCRSEWIFLDGRTFSRREQLECVIGFAEAGGFAWKILCTVAPPRVAEERITRSRGRHPAANRTVVMYREVKARFDRILREHREIDTSRPLEECVREADAYLRTNEA